jgi:protein SHQ1
MPITPRFALSQTNDDLIVTIYVPHVRVSTETVQITLDGCSLHFASPPYLLHLNFEPFSFHPHDQPAATYEPTIENGIIELKCKKETPQDWPDLDLVGKWMPRKSSHNPTWLQQVIASETNESVNDTADNVTERLAAFQPCGYGFLRMFYDVYADLVREGLGKEMLMQPWEQVNLIQDRLDGSCETVYTERRTGRLEQELEAFSAERYLQDLDVEDDYIYQCAVSMDTHWRQANASQQDCNAAGIPMSPIFFDNGQSCSSSNGNDKAVESAQSDTIVAPFFTSDELLQLSTLPYPLLPSDITVDQQSRSICVLLDILFAYMYDYLTTMGDPTVESAWTVSTISASLSCLEDWEDEETINEASIVERKSLDSGQSKNSSRLDGSLNEPLQTVVASCIRRSLIYPYLRNLSFSVHVWKQVVDLIRYGRLRSVIRSLLQVHSVLEKSELYYLCNKVWINPILAWVQGQPMLVEGLLDSAVTAIEDAIRDENELKGMIGLNLERIEQDTAGSEEDDSSSDEEDDEEEDEDEDDSSSDENEDDGENEDSCKSDCNDNSLPTQIENQSTPTPNTVAKAATIVSTELLDLEGPTAALSRLVISDDTESCPSFTKATETSTMRTQLTSDGLVTNNAPIKLIEEIKTDMAENAD